MRQADRGELWAYEEVAPHWDSLVLRSWIDDDVLYQEGALASFLHPDELVPLARAAARLTAHSIFCGTIPSIGPIWPAAGSFSYQLVDPVLGRTLEGAYLHRPLPLIV